MDLPVPHGKEEQREQVSLGTGTRADKRLSGATERGRRADVGRSGS